MNRRRGPGRRSRVDWVMSIMIKDPNKRTWDREDGRIFADGTGMSHLRGNTEQKQARGPEKTSPLIPRKLYAYLAPRASAGPGVLLRLSGLTHLRAPCPDPVSACIRALVSQCILILVVMMGRASRVIPRTWGPGTCLRLELSSACVRGGCNPDLPQLSGRSHSVPPLE